MYKWHLYWEILSGNHAMNGNQYCLTHLGTWWTLSLGWMYKTVTSSTTCINTMLLLRLLPLAMMWCLMRIMSAIPAVEMDLTHFRFTASFVTIKDLYFQLREACLVTHSHWHTILDKKLRCVTRSTVKESMLVMKGFISKEEEESYEKDLFDAMSTFLIL